MRFKRQLNYEHGLGQLDIVPLVNVVFLLLIFVLVIVGFMGLPGVKVSLPGIITGSAFKTQNLEIVIDKGGSVFYGGRQISLSLLKGLILQLPASRTSVLIKADKDVPLAAVMQIWKICQDLGLREVNIATDKE